MNMRKETEQRLSQDLQSMGSKGIPLRSVADAFLFCPLDGTIFPVVQVQNLARRP